MSDWIAALRHGQDMSTRLTSRDPIDIYRDEHGSDDHQANINPRSGGFVVRGRDAAPKHHIARILTQLSLNLIILAEQPGHGPTFIEKLQRHTRAAFAVALLTPEDMRYLGGEEHNLKKRARQYVISELGYFIGSLGGTRVCVLKKGDMELPSDWIGVEYKRLKDSRWQLAVAKELRGAGFDVVRNKL